MSGTSQSEVATLLRDILQQQTAMLQLQRVVVEHLLGVASTSSEQPTDAEPELPALATPTTVMPVAPAPAADPAPGASTPTPAPIAAPAPALAPTSRATAASTDLAFAPPAAEQRPARGARYYQSRPLPGAESIQPEELELMRRLQEMRDASDLILQFGSHKGSTLAQVAISNPEYIRELMTRAQRPEVRAAAGRLVEALDAAADHKRKSFPRLRTRGGVRS